MSSNAKEPMRSGTGAKRRLRFLLFVFATVLLTSLSMGRYMVSPKNVLLIFLDSLVSHTTGKHLDLNLAEVTQQMQVVIMQIRFPRVIAAAIIGSALSVSGLVYQGMFKNPMVSPDILGASAGAGFGAALGILMRLGCAGITATAFALGLLAVGTAYFAARRFKGNAALGLVLAGVMTGSLFQAATSFVKLLADPTDQLPAITYWLMGSLASIRNRDLLLLIPVVTLGAVPLFLLRWRLNVLTLDDGEARSLGVNTSLLQMTVIICATLMTAACVSVSGMIGWVGLIIPHLARRLIGNDLRYLLPAAALIGAAFLPVTDDIARTALTSEIPIGILTAFVGAPFFLYLIMGGGKKHEHRNKRTVLFLRRK